MKVRHPLWIAAQFTLVSLLVVGVVVGKQCVGVGPCACTFDDGSGTVDLSSTGNKDGTARYHDYPGADSYFYSYNPCAPFTDGGCVDVAVCQTDNAKTAYYNLGTQDTAQWSYDGTNIQIYYYALTDAMRETFVTVKCDPKYDEPFVSIQGEQPLGYPQYYVEITTKCACPGMCGTTVPTDESGSLSGGTILIIIVFVSGFMYIVVGMGVLKTRYQATGADMFPNRTFWGSLPGLVKDGFVFTFRLFRGKSKTGYQDI
ncbi:uncharacterized protein LOC121381985 [Gigantopelta aegis]|uniref:uncharacterized protein LOC121381985 n=1 Tax=Gigantopelta aegis TaxID=1735272 RepID=UPI001B88A99D|nr:uncharacterized protein LOC121381985 [Gigantopelta aegis]